MKKGWIIAILILIAAAFFVGYFMNSSDEDVQDLQNRITELERLNSELNSQITTLTSEKADLQAQVQDLQEQLEDCEIDCDKIVENSKGYYEDFKNISCVLNSDCVDINPPGTCGACVSSLINTSKIDRYNKQYRDNNCEGFGCPAVMMYCRCINSTCQFTY
jgi:TolA-binding protein